MGAVLGINAVFHDPAAALVVDGTLVAAAEEERFTRRKHGKEPVPFSTWELPSCAARWCLEAAGLRASELDAVGYSYDPGLARRPAGDLVADGWEDLRTLYVRRAPLFLRTALPGLEPGCVRYVPHHVAHAASAYLTAPVDRACVLVVDGRGEDTSALAGAAVGGVLDVFATQRLPHSIGLAYESATEHLGFRRSSDEYKVMALAAYGEPRFLPALRAAMRADGRGGFVVEPIDWSRFVRRREPESDWSPAHADLAASVQARTEELLLAVARWLHMRAPNRTLAYAGGVALNCVANSRLLREGPFEDVWIPPAAGDSGTALGAALYLAHAAGDAIRPLGTAALGRSWSESAIARALDEARVPAERPAVLADAVAGILAADGVVGWFQGRSEFGPRALGHRSLLADPRRAGNLERLNVVKGREQFRPVAPMVLLEHAAEIFDGPLPSPYMLFTHRVRDAWRTRIPAALHVDGSARVQTVDRRDEPLLAALLDAFAARTGVPVLINTSFNTAGRPMVDDVRDALECFGSSPMDALVLGSHLVRRRADRQAAA
jgi:carbamoyltransferase